MTPMAAEHWLASLTRASVQGGVALLLVWAIGRALPRLSPGARCWLWRLAFLKMLLALVWTVPLDVPLLPAVAAPAPPPPLRFLPPAPFAPRAAPPVPSGPTEPTVARRPDDTGDHRAFPAAAWLLVLGGWAAGAAWSARRLVCQWQALRRVQRACAAVAPQNNAALAAADWGALCQAFGLRRPPRLLVSEAGDGPLLLGLWRPAVVVPSALLSEGSPGDVRLVLAHELAHLRRYDLWWNALPALAQVVFFFHPLAYLAGRSWHLAQEMAADERALCVTRAPIEDYGALLVRVAAARRGVARPGSLMAVRAVDSPRILQKRLIAMKTFVPVSRARRAATTAALLTSAGLGLAPWRAVAQQPRPVAPTAAPTAAPSPPAVAVSVPAIVPAAPPSALKRAGKSKTTGKKSKPVAPARPTIALPALPPTPVPAVRPVAAPAASATRLRPAAATPAPVVPLAVPRAAPPAVALAAVPPAITRAPAAPVTPATAFSGAAAVAAVPGAAARILADAAALPISALATAAPQGPKDAAAAADNAAALQAGEQIAARLENLGDQLSPQYETLGERIGELAERLARTDLTEAERADLTRQITQAGQEMAAAILPIVRESLRSALPAMRHGVEQALASGKVTPAQIRADLDRSFAEARRDINNEGDLSPALRGQVEQILRDVRQEIEKSIRAYEASPKRRTAAPPAPASARP